MINFSHCQEKNEAPFVSRMGLDDFGFRIADLKKRNLQLKMI